MQIIKFCVGPLIAKTEFMISNKFGVGINASFSQSKISWLDDGYDTVQQSYRKFEFALKHMKFQVL
jgi:glycerol kinase